MLSYLIKIFVTALMAVAVSELARRSTLWAAVLASLPLTSLLAFIWLYLETDDKEKIAKLSWEILWLVLPSLILFIVFPLLLRSGWNFWLSLGVASGSTALTYFAMIRWFV